MVVQMTVAEFEATIQKVVKAALSGSAPSKKEKKEKKEKKSKEAAAAEDEDSVASSRPKSEAQTEWSSLSTQVTKLVQEVKKDELAAWEKKGKDEKSKPSYAQGFHLKVGGRVKALAKESGKPLSSFVELEKIREIVTWLRANPEYKSANALKEPKADGEKKKAGRPKKAASPISEVKAKAPAAAKPAEDKDKGEVEDEDEEDQEAEPIRINGTLYHLDPKTNILYEDVDGAMGEAAGKLNEDGDEMIPL
jgi:hypothetical protein